MIRMKLQDGFEMNYEVIPGLLPTDTLFIHGNLASNAWWRPSIEVWKAQAKPSFTGRAILAEWRGCGDSSSPLSAGDLSIDKMADDYNSLLENLEIKKACVVGHSTGGLIALSAISKKPELFERAFLLDSVAAAGRQFTPESLAAFQAMSTDRKICGAILGATIYQNDFDGPVFQRIIDDAFRVSKLNWLGVPRALSQFNMSDRLNEIDIPITVAHGEYDLVLPIEAARTMATQLPRGSFVELKNQGHCMNVENPKGFVSLVNESLFTQGRT